MEPVPETEKMENPRTSPIPTLKLKDSSYHLHQKYDSAIEKPFTPRRSTETKISSIASPSMDNSHALYHQPEPSSPYRERIQSRFSKNNPFPPPISRTQSMPGYYSNGHVYSSQTYQIPSPRSSVQRARFPRKPVDEVFVGLTKFPSRGVPGTPDLISEEDESTSNPFDECKLKGHTSLSRSRRPISPHLTPTKTPPSSYTSTPFSFSSYSSRLGDQYIANRNYCYSGALSFPGSFSSYSIPSTPTSARSRSSSISSLETIPDSPDAEEAALEADRIARLKAETEVSEDYDETKTKFSRDAISSRGRIIGTGFGRDKRKRWSVCGAERRGDLNLDTIWED